MKIKPLSTISFTAVVDCFLKAFEDYFVPMPEELSYYKKRWEAACIDFNYSFGFFENELLVGFILTGIDTRNDLKIAYNMGTGVLPNYRGQNIVGQLYDHAIPLFKTIGVQVCQLEVIQNNMPALKTYQRIGFSIQKEFLCYTFETSLFEQKNDIELKKVELQELIPFVKSFNQNYSWDNQIESLLRNDLSAFIVSVGKVKIAYFIIDLNSGYIAQMEVFADIPENWERLIQSIFYLVSEGKIHNVDNRLMSKIQSLNDFNFQNVINQFEMKLLI
jgi:GNAT superfamily N-acetyltransferase